MGGVFGPEYAGADLVLEDGQHGIGICERLAAGRYFTYCPAGHVGKGRDGHGMPLCGPEVMTDPNGGRWMWPGHPAILLHRMLATCTACVMPGVSRGLWDDQERAKESLRRAYEARDGQAVRRIQAQIEDIGKAQVELTMRGLTPRRPMRLVEVS